jgi:hypothetical protein
LWYKWSRRDAAAPSLVVVVASLTRMVALARVSYVDGWGELATLSIRVNVNSVNKSTFSTEVADLVEEEVGTVLKRSIVLLLLRVGTAAGALCTLAALCYS